MNLVITGMGGVTPLGHTWEETAKNLYLGKNGVGPITLFDASNFRVKIAAEVKDWNPLEELPIDDYLIRTGDAGKWMARATQFAISATHQAVNQAGLDTKKFGNKGGLWLGNGGGGISGYFDVTKAILEDREERVRGDFMVRALQNMIAAWSSRVLGIRGPTQNVQTACASSIDALAAAAAFVTSPIYDLKFAVVVGAESGIDPNNTAAFAGTGALSKNNDDPEHASRPFDGNRDGFVMSEGAGAYVIEEEAFAKARRATPLARVQAISVGSAGGVGDTDNRGPSWLTEPNVPFCTELARQGLEKAGWIPESVDVWVAHGTSTKKNDLSETRVIKNVFGEQAFHLAVPAIKSMLGHGLGAAGAWNTLAAVTMLQENRVPPTINYENADPDCDLDYVPNKARKMEVNRCVVAALGFGDQNGYVFLEKFNGWEI